MKQFYIASNINLHAVFYSIPPFFSFSFWHGWWKLPFGWLCSLHYCYKEERYTCVTFSELCPSPSLIMAMATPSSLAVVAQLWRAT